MEIFILGKSGKMKDMDKAAIMNFGARIFMQAIGYLIKELVKVWKLIILENIFMMENFLRILNKEKEILLRMDILFLGFFNSNAYRLLFLLEISLRMGS